MNVPPSLRVQDFRKFTGAQAISLCGSVAESVAKTTILYKAAGLWGLSTATQLILFTQAVTALFGGRLVDRFSRWSVMLWTQRLLTAEALTACLFQGIGILNSGTLYALMAFASLVGGINTSAQGAVVRAILRHKHNYTDGLRISLIVAGVAGAVGSQLGGVFSNSQWSMWLFAFNAASYLPMLNLLSRLKVREVEQVEKVEQTNPKAPLLPALKQILSERDAKWALIIFGGVTIACSNGSVMQPLVADKLLGSPHAYALLLGANCVGNLLTALPQLGGKKKVPMSFLFMAAALYGGLGVIYGASSLMALSMVALAGACGGGGAVRVLTTTLVMSDEDRTRDGRRQGIYQSIGIGGAALSALLASGGVAFFGVRFVAVGGALLALCFTLLCWAVYNRRRMWRKL